MTNGLVLQPAAEGPGRRLERESVMDDVSRGQVNRSAAEIYDEFFVPALFQEWPSRLADRAQLRAGERVLDVACGTGVLAREAASRVGPQGAVVGLDLNEGMLAVARRKAPAIEWRQGKAEALPFPDRSFDAVLCQFGLMFFEDPAAALGEMWRVLKPRGRLVVAVWDAAERSPGYAAMIRLLQRLFGERIADELRGPFRLGDPARFRRLLKEASVAEPAIVTVEGKARFPSIEAWVHTDVKGWTLADLIDDDQYRRLLLAAERELAVFCTPAGTVEFAAPAHIASATKA
jgi:ubiquinone/menaquinone biosynthesis C-methylase UbiE